MTDIYGFDQTTSRELVRMLHQYNRKVDTLARRISASGALGASRRVKFAIPKTTLEPGGTCEAYLTKYSQGDAKKLVANTNSLVTIEDPLSIAFAVGTDDYSSTTDYIPVVKDPMIRAWIPASQYGLIQQAKPDSTIATGGAGTFSIYQDQTDTTVNVDSVSVLWGDNGEGVSSGKESWIRWNGTRWEWIGGDEDEPTIGVGRGTLNSALATTDSTISVTLDGSSAVGSGTITANNFCAFSADSGAKCYVSTSDGTTWELIQVACPA